MLMVDGVKLIAFHELQQMRELQGDYPVRLKQKIQSGNEVTKIRHLCEHVVANQKIGLPSIRGEFRGQLRTEKFNQRSHTFLHGDFRDVGSRLDPNTGICFFTKYCSK